MVKQDTLNRDFLTVSNNNIRAQEQKEKKIAIIENEFGEISIDDALLQVFVTPSSS